jgi:hypothetical protein
MDLGQLEATKAAWGDELAKEIAQEEGQDCSIVLQVGWAPLLGHLQQCCCSAERSSALLCLDRQQAYHVAFCWFFIQYSCQHAVLALVTKHTHHCSAHPATLYCASAALACKQLPDGTQHLHTFKMGATVAYVKLQVEQAYSIPMGKQKLTTSQGKTLIDPLSLADCPGITPDAACLVVVSELGEQ